MYSALFVTTRHGGLHIAGPSFSNDSPFKNLPRILAVFAFIASSILFTMHRSPLTYHAYTAFPIYFWGEVLQAVFSALWCGTSTPHRKNSINKKVSAGALCLRAVAVVFALQAMVVRVIVSFIASSSISPVLYSITGSIHASVYLEHRILIDWSRLASSIFAACCSEE